MLPSMAQQRTVVDTLADIDAQIEIQRAVADRLEAIRPAIFGEMIQEPR